MKAIAFITAIVITASLLTGCTSSYYLDSRNWPYYDPVASKSQHVGDYYYRGHYHHNNYYYSGHYYNGAWSRYHDSSFHRDELHGEGYQMMTNGKGY